MKRPTQLKEQEKLHSNNENPMILQRIERTMVEAIGKLELGQDKNMDYIVKLIDQNNEVCLKKLNQCSRELEEIKEVCLSLRKSNSDITETLVRMDKQLNKRPMSHIAHLKKNSSNQ